MGILAAMVNSLSTFYPKSQDPHQPGPRCGAHHPPVDVAKMPTLAAIDYKNNLGHPIMYRTTAWATSRTSSA